MASNAVGLNATPNTVSECPALISVKSLPVSTSNTLISPSSVGAPPPVASSLPSGENAIAHTRSANPAIRFVGSAFSTLQIVNSWKLPVMSVLPSGLKAIDSTSEMCAAFAGFPSGVFSCGSKSDFAYTHSCLSLSPFFSAGTVFSSKR